MLEYHWRKGHFYVLEQPISSLLWRMKCVLQCLERHGAQRAVVHLGTYGASTLKPVPGTDFFWVNVLVYFLLLDLNYLLCVPEAMAHRTTDQ